ncbi:MAG: preprotein translocase subunit SecG [Thermanaeromonas sp.]|uniref:preprotein translocase subunit SecG n=1 Tax=Thermanaeromonas sp. TaxID=2003697 RepID=UPI00243B4640|nr:preprotein translocase subunit SecG [Thermanaeromonas sp.]MCG0277464.1 preprotein translocase subunit SecG [Thermanaeromonas sp.]
MLKSLLLFLQIFVALALIASILLQSSRSAGVSGVIAGGAESLFGKKKGLDEFLAKISTGLAAAFFIFTLLLSLV